MEFLRDQTGNRRFWPVVVGINNIEKNLFQDLNQAEIDQIWAEAFQLWNNGEELFLKDELAKEAIKVQENHTEISSLEGLIREYLDRKLPVNWDDMNLGARRRYIHYSDFSPSEEGTVIRTKVCAMEVYSELFQGETMKISTIAIYLT